MKMVQDKLISTCNILCEPLNLGCEVVVLICASDLAQPG